MTTRPISLLAFAFLLTFANASQAQTPAPANTLPPAPAGYHWWLVPNTPPGTPPAAPIPTVVNPPTPQPQPVQPAATTLDPAQIAALIQSGIQTSLASGIIQQPKTADRYLAYSALAGTGLTLLTSLFAAFRGQQTHTLASNDTTNPAVHEAVQAKAPAGFTLVPTAQVASAVRPGPVPRMPGT